MATRHQAGFLLPVVPMAEPEARACVAGADLPLLASGRSSPLPCLPRFSFPFPLVGAGRVDPTGARRA